PGSRVDAVLGERFHDLVRSESLNAESYVGPEGCGLLALDQRDELRSGPDSEDRTLWLLVSLPLHVGQPQIPFETALDIRHHQPDVVQSPDRDLQGVTWPPGRLRGDVAHLAQKSSSSASVHRIELKREAVRVVEIDAVYGFAFPKNRLSRSLHLRESSHDPVDLEILDSLADMKQADCVLANGFQIQLQRPHVS